SSSDPIVEHHTDECYPNTTTGSKSALISLQYQTDFSSVLDWFAPVHAAPLALAYGPQTRVDRMGITWTGGLEMERHFICGLVLLALTATGAARAADMPVKAPVHPAPPVYSWTGFYIGGNVGYSVARDPTSSPFFEPQGPNNPCCSFFNNEQVNLSPAGVIGGGQIGFNWQVAPSWVLGAEADFQGSAEKDSRTCILSCLPIPGQTELFTQSIDWFGTLRGRLGWTNGPTLLYATGGLAYGRVTTQLTYDRFNGAVFSGSFGEDKSGWTVGGGIETQLAGNWTVKVEYLYMDLGTTSGTVPVITSIPGSTFSLSGRMQDHVGRLGLNYKFGDPVYVAPAAGGMSIKAAPAAVVSNWSGLYIGGNVGVSIARNTSSDTQTSPVFGFISSDAFYTSPIGVVGGGQIGFNVQAAPNWVLGLEADFQGSGQRDSTTCIDACQAVPPGFVSVNETLTQSVEWFGTARGRVGWTNGPALFFATGGFAYGKVTASLNTVFTDSVATLVTSSGSFSQNKSGWTAGGGVETKLGGNWSAKVEYLYVDLGTFEGSTVAAGNFAPLNGDVFTFSSHLQDHIIRFGLNYKLDSSAVVARY
ncbi:MAG TPA: outer membrane beta-barrel protein, partial [Xanthobacteraceae bacterium]